MNENERIVVDYLALATEQLQAKMKDGRLRAYERAIIERVGVRRLHDMMRATPSYVDLAAWAALAVDQEMDPVWAAEWILNGFASPPRWLLTAPRPRDAGWVPCAHPRQMTPDRTLLPCAWPKCPHGRPNPRRITAVLAAPAVRFNAGDGQVHVCEEMHEHLIWERAEYRLGNGVATAARWVWILLSGGEL